MHLPTCVVYVGGNSKWDMTPLRLQSHKTWILSLTDLQVLQCQVLHSLLISLGLDHFLHIRPGQIEESISPALLSFLGVPESSFLWSCQSHEQ
uniref:Uncharacterized protein MANES_04G004400 n=1 Tax=Rhizophora mucronata TaxID=61149 RepID=A0A2P2KLH5_RHIMU